MDIPGLKVFFGILFWIVVMFIIPIKIEESINKKLGRISNQKFSNIVGATFIIFPFLLVSIQLILKYFDIFPVFTSGLEQFFSNIMEDKYFLSFLIMPFFIIPVLSALWFGIIGLVFLIPVIIFSFAYFIKKY
jgi:hypothetical protein